MIHNIIKIFLIYFILLLIPASIYAKETITVAIDYEYAPLTYKSFEGKPEGLFVEFWKLWGKKSGYDIKFKFYDWDSSVEAVRDGDAIFHSGLTPDAKWMVSSDKFYELKTSFYKLKDKKLPNKLKIGSIDSYYSELAKKKYPNAKIIKYNDYLPLIKDLLNNKINLLIDDEIAINQFLLQKGVKSNFTIIGDSFYSDINVITNQKNKKFIPIFNKYLKQITTKEFSVIENNILSNKRSYYTSMLNNKKIHFTKKEQKWLDKKERVTYVYDPDWAPFEWNNGVNHHVGIIADIIDLIHNRSGINFKSIHTKTWAESTELVKAHKVDMYSAVVETKDRKKDMNFTTKSIFSYYGSLVGRKSDHIKITDIATNLKNKKIGLTRGNALAFFIKKRYPNLHYIDVDSTNDGFKKLESKAIDIYVINVVTANYFINNKGFSNIEIVDKLDYILKLKIAISKRKAPEVISIINKVIATIKEEELQTLYDKWTKNIDNIVLTEKEKLYLKNQKALRYVYDNHRKPFEYRNELGIHSGITSDILNLISKKSSLKFEAIKTKNWEEATKLIKANKADMFSFVTETKKREQYLNFINKTLFTIPIVFVNNINDEKIYENTKFDLQDKKIGVIKGKAIHKKLLSKFPYLHFIELSSLEEGFKKVQNGKIDMFAINKSTAKYYIRLKSFNKIKIATNIGISFKFKIALQKSLPPEALSIINKSLEKITSNDINYIYNKYINIKIEEKTDWALISKVGGVIFIFIFFILWNNKKLKSMVDEKTKKLNVLLTDFDKNIIASKTDENGKITYVSRAFCDTCQYTESELLGKKHNIIKDSKTLKSTYKDLWDTIISGKSWKGQIRNLKKDGSSYWVSVSIFPEYDNHHTLIGYSSISHNITNQKKVEDLTLNLEKKIIERTKELNEEKQFIQALFDSQEQLIITTDGSYLMTANKTFLDFFKVKDINHFMTKYDAKCICDTFNIDSPDEYLKVKMGKDSWIDHMISFKRLITHKVMITLNETDFIFSVTATNLPFQNGIKSAVFTNITDIENAKVEIEDIHKHTKESIEYASLIQGALIPDNKVFHKYFRDYFTIWNPKDTVGGDIYLFEELRDDNEALLMVIDCTGHGVPGAFVTMLVKAIERQIVSQIKHSDERVSPAKILSIFNRHMKKLLKQEDINSISNAGFDGGIIYYNKKDKTVTFAGAQTPLFYIEDNELNMVKGDRYSVGYKKCDIDYEYKEYTIDIKDGMQFYITTDGYIDQNGGNKGFPLGKTRFKHIIKNSSELNMQEQKVVFLDELEKYQNNYDINDDITMIGFKI